MYCILPVRGPEPEYFPSKLRFEHIDRVGSVGFRQGWLQSVQGLCPERLTGVEHRSTYSSSRDPSHSTKLLSIRSPWSSTPGRTTKGKSSSGTLPRTMKSSTASLAVFVLLEVRLRLGKPWPMPILLCKVVTRPFQRSSW